MIETVFGVRDGAPLMDHMHVCLVALAAAYGNSNQCLHLGCLACDHDVHLNTSVTPLWSARR
jgi:hypothetical protein